MKKWKARKMEFTNRSRGDLIKVEIRDETRRLIYRSKFNIRDKNAIISILQVLEKYSGFSLLALIREKLKNEWV